MSDWIDCMNALEPELLEVTLRSGNPPPRTGVKCSIKCSCRSRGFLQSGGKSERFLNVFLFINFSYDIDNKLEVVAQI